MSYDVEVRLNGALMARQDVTAATLDQRLMRPAQLTVEFPAMLPMDANKEIKPKIGGPIEMAVIGPSGPVKLFKGKVSSIEAFDDPSGMIFRVKAYDVLHQLTGGTNSTVHVNKKVSDVMKAVLSSVGGKVEATTVVHDHIWQMNESDYDFLVRLAVQSGRLLVVDKDKVDVIKIPKASTGKAGRHSVGEEAGPLEFTPGGNVFAWQGRVTASEVTNGVVTNSMDDKGKAITAKHLNGSTMVKPGQKLTSAGTLVQTRSTATPSMLRETAQFAAEIQDKGHMELLLQSVGMPKVKVGKVISFGDVGKPFDGLYTATRVVHRIDYAGFITEVECTGLNDRSVLGSFDEQGDVGGGRRSRDPVRAIVTNINDPDKMSRVKVKYPWLDDAVESHWAPVMAPGAGKDKGFTVLPSVNDEVMVVFLDGDPDQPIVVGGLYNKTNKAIGPAQAGGKYERQVWKSTIGHEIALVDKKGSEGITITSGNKDVVVHIDQKNKKVKVTTKKSDVEVKAGGAVKVETPKDVTLKGKNVRLEASANLTLKAGATANLNASGTTTIKGKLIKLN